MRKFTHRILHKDVIEPLRDYQAFKEYYQSLNRQLPISEIKKQIKETVRRFTSNYMCDLLRPNVSGAVKYLIGRELRSIRVGEDSNLRSSSPERIEDCHVYALLNPGAESKRPQYIYVKNIDKLETEELAVLGNRVDGIKSRAMGKYKTFLAMPIRSGYYDSDNSNTEWKSRANLGIIGFDLKKAYGFRSLPEHELECMACFADIISEPLEDLIKLETKNA